MQQADVAQGRRDTGNPRRYARRMGGRTDLCVFWGSCCPYLGDIGRIWQGAQADLVPESALSQQQRRIVGVTAAHQLADGQSAGFVRHARYKDITCKGYNGGQVCVHGHVPVGRG